MIVDASGDCGSSNTRGRPSTATEAELRMPELDPVFRAQWLARQHRFEECISLCTELLANNPYDQAVWFLKCRTLTLKAWVDDTDFEEEGFADVLLDENATAALPRPGTSLSRPITGVSAGNPAQGMRPVSSSGRPLSGYARPGTGSAQQSSHGSLEAAMQGGRPGTASRPMTALGRLVRLGTASMLSESNGPFIRVERLDLKKYAARPELAKVLFDYTLYHDHNPRKALELANYATQIAKVLYSACLAFMLSRRCPSCCLFILVGVDHRDITVRRLVVEGTAG